MSLIKLERIQKVYNVSKTLKDVDKEVHALRGVSLEVEEGELIAIIGPSGSGKSTLLHILGCLDVVTSGFYYLEGTNTYTLKPKELARLRNEKIGFVLQDFGLIPSDTCLQNVAVPLMFSKEKYKNIIPKCKAELERMGLKSKMNTPVSQLSGGQKQRVAIARALVTNPDIILADEPTGALDSKNSKEIMDLLLELNKKGKTVIFVTHNEELAEQCNRIIRVVDGLISEDRILKK